MRLLFICISLISYCFSQYESHLKSKLMAKWDSLHNDTSYPGGSFGVSLPNGHTIGLSIGYADVENKLKMKATDKLLTGSSGKTYFSAIAMRLIYDGTLKLDKKVKDYIGNYSWYSRIQNANDITIRMIMNHTSGIERYVFDKQFENSIQNEPEKVWTVEDRLSYIFDKQPLFKAGSDFAYSDLNYIILGAVIEKITKRKIYDLADEWLLKPFNLNQTTKTDQLEVDGLVPGYTGPEGIMGIKGKTFNNGKSVYNLQFEWTGGGYAASGHDLAKWSKLLYEWNAFSPEMKTDFLQTTQKSIEKMRRGYGLGVFVFKVPRLGYDAVGHSGFMPGYFTEMFYLPKYKVSFALIINSSERKYRRDFFGHLISLVKTTVDFLEQREN